MTARGPSGQSRRSSSQHKLNERVAQRNEAHVQNDVTEEVVYSATCSANSGKIRVREGVFEKGCLLGNRVQCDSLFAKPWGSVNVR
eukprot:COSAG06_NODE_2070_length_7666_cov_135.939078_6_plen_86_part_00